MGNIKSPVHPVLLHCTLGMSDLVRAGSVGKGGLGGVGRQTRIEKPRPLKMSGGTQPELRPEDLLVVVENVIRGLNVRQYDDQMVGQVGSLCANLKRSGAQMESSHKDPMDRLLSALVAACRDEDLDLICRVHMLEIIELRSMGWQTNENVTNYYKQKLAQIDNPPPRVQTAPVQLNPAAPDFNPCGKDSFTSSCPRWWRATSSLRGFCRAGENRQGCASRVFQRVQRASNGSHGEKFGLGGVTRCCYGISPEKQEQLR